jgi:hypothetical protein
MRWQLLLGMLDKATLTLAITAAWIFPDRNFHDIEPGRRRDHRGWKADGLRQPKDKNRRTG